MGVEKSRRSSSYKIDQDEDTSKITYNEDPDQIEEEDEEEQILYKQHSYGS